MNSPRGYSDETLAGWRKAMGRRIVLAVLALGISACSSGPQVQISGNLKQLSRSQSVAILPVETLEKGQRDAAAMFHRSLYANLTQARFNVLERYVVESLLVQNGLTDPSKYNRVPVARLGEILGADAVVFGRIQKVERAYLVLHSSIAVGMSATMVDTRTGEILWQAEESRSDFSGLGKLPTGMFAAVYAPIYFVTNKLNLRKMTTDMTNGMTALVRKPEEKPARGKNSGEVQLAQATRKRAKDMRAPRPGDRRDDRRPVPSLPRPVPATVISPAPATNSGEPVKALPDIKVAPRQSGPAPVQLAALRTPEKKDGVRNRASSKGRAKAPVSPENDESVFYTIQVGAYQTKALAESMINSLAMKGYNAFMTLLHNNGGDYYKVQVERFDDKERAQMFSKELEMREKLDTFVIRFD
ncbi:MAG: DUF799 family lipoprotein [Nitrospinae bacterium]|nr:DUF799 family lipoprotein [Nitrospinota bacterium]